MILLQKCIVHPWFCDVMGHMNTRHYMAMFDDAAYQLLAEVTGWYVGAEHWQGKGWVDVNNSIDYLGELKAGTLVNIKGGVVAISKSSFTAKYVMSNTLTGERAAVMQAKLVCFDSGARRSLRLWPELQQQLEAHKLTEASS